MFPTTIRSTGTRSAATRLTVALVLSFHFAGAPGPAPAHAAPLCDTPCAGELLAIDGLPSLGAFARAVDVDAGRCVVGASVPFPGLDPAAAFVYTFDGNDWTAQTLDRPDLLPNESFGADVAIDGTVVIVGAPATTISVDATGAAYIFTSAGTGDAFTFVQRLTNDDPSFGTSVAVHDGRIIIAGPDAAPSGSVLVYEPSVTTPGQWTLLETIIDATAPIGDRFGTDIALIDNTMVVRSQSRVHVFEHTLDDDGDGDGGDGESADNAWTMMNTWMIDDLGAVMSMSTDGTTLALGGAPIRVAQRDGDGWTIPASMGADGASIAVAGDVMIIGRPNVNGVMLFVRDASAGWSCARVFDVPSVSAGAQLGATVAIGTSWIIAGAPLASIAGPTTGAALVADVSSCLKCVSDCTPVAGDGTVGNGEVNIDDVIAVVLAIGAPGGPCDVDPPGGDGVVDIADLTRVVADLGSICFPP